MLRWATRLYTVIYLLLLCAILYNVQIVASDYVDQTTTPRLFYLSALMIVCNAVSVVSIVVNNRLKLSLTDVAVLLFFSYGACHCLWFAESSTLHLYTWIVLISVYVFVRTMPPVPHIKELVFSVIMLSGLYQALLGVQQIYGIKSSLHSSFASTGTFFNPGPYAGYLAIVFCFAIVYALQNTALLNNQKFPIRRFIFNLRKINTLLAVATSVAIFIVLPSTLSRSAWLAVCGALFIWAIFNKAVHRYIQKYKRHLKLAAAIIALLLVGLCVGLYQLKQGSVDGRLQTWQRTVVAIGEQPVLGSGGGTFGGAYASASEKFNQTVLLTGDNLQSLGVPEYAFNEYLQMATEYGVLGLILFAIAVTMCLAGLRRRYNWCVYGTVAGLVFAFTSYPFQIISISVLLIVMAAMITQKNTSLPRWMAFGCIPLLILGSVFVVYTLKSDNNAYRQHPQAKLLYNLELYEDAVEEYETLYPNLKCAPKYLFEYGHALNKIGRYAESNLILARGTKYSADPMFHNVMGNNYKALGETDKAAGSYESALYIMPNRMYPLFLLTTLYYEYGDSVKCQYWGRRLLESAPKVESQSTKEMRDKVKKMLKW